jgi:cyanate permease
LLTLFFLISVLGVCFLPKETLWWRSSLGATIVSGTVLAVCLVMNTLLSKMKDDDDDPQFPPLH